MLDYDPKDRAAFDAALVAALSAALPDATFTWSEENRRLTATFPDGKSESIWEPNFYFCRGVYYTDLDLFSRAASHLAGAQANAERFARLVGALPKLVIACQALQYAELLWDDTRAFEEAFIEAGRLARDALAEAHGELQGDKVTS
jgi:hypothetical protein